MENIVREMSSITVSISVGENNPGRITSTDISFIYGLETGGLTPFESTLADKRCGDVTEIAISAAEGPLFFGKLFPRVKEALGGSNGDKQKLHVKVLEIKPAGNAEIVKALAGQISHCGSGDCGCGCS